MTFFSKEYNKLISDTFFFKAIHFLYALVILIFVLFCASCKTTVSNTANKNAEEVISVKDFGAKGDGRTDDTQAILAAFQSLQKSSKAKELHFPKGRYVLKQPLYKGVLHKDLTISGSVNTEILCEKYFGMFSSAEVIKLAPISNLKRGAKSIKLKSTSSIKAGDILTIFSNLPGEKSWNYKKSDIHEVQSVSGNSVTLTALLNFNYTQAREKIDITVYRKKKISFRDLKFTFNQAKTWTSKLCIRLDALTASFTNISVNNISQSRGSSLIGLYSCLDVDFTGLKMNSSLYGVLINNSRDITATDVYATDMNHPLVPATWSTNLTFKKLRGKNIAVDAHPSFNVSYEDVDIDMGKSYFNCRAIGLKLKDCRFVADKDFAEGSVYIGAAGLTEEVTPLLKEYSIILDNVHWVHKMQGFNGFTISEGHNIKIKNCTTHSVFIGRRCKNILIENSRLSLFQINEGTFTLRNVTFDGKLPFEGMPDAPLAFSWGGQATIENCSFSNYNPQKTYLIGLMNSAEGSIVTFKNCKINGFKGIVKKFVDFKKDYDGLTFEKCTIENIKTPISKQILNKPQAVKNCSFKNIPVDARLKGQ